MSKLFSTLEKEARVTVSLEDAMESMFISTESSAELHSIIGMINDSYSYIGNLNIAIESAEDVMLSGREVTVADIASLQTARTITADNLGLELDTSSVVSIEDITEIKETMVICLEDSRNVITKALAEINKVFARVSNTLLKYLSIFDTALGAMFTNLKKKENTIKELQKKGLKPSDSGITDDSFFKLNSVTVLALLGMSTEKDSVKAIDKILKTYSSPSLIKNMVDSMISSIDDDKNIKPIFDNKFAMKLLDSGFLSKIKSFFCKRDKGNRLIIGAYYNTIYILERCKFLHIDISIMPYSYNVETVKFDPINSMGASTLNMNNLSYKEMLSLIAKAKTIAVNSKKVTKDMHNILEIGSKTIEDIDEKVSFENLGFYKVLPIILLTLAKTYAELPTAINAISGLFIADVKNNT